MSTETAPILPVEPSGPTGPNDAAFAARADAANKVSAAPEQSFAGGKFSSAAELESAYIALQSKLGSPVEAAEESPVDAGAAANTEKAETAATLTTDTFDAYVSEFQTKGQLSEESYKALDKLGVSRGLVDSYIEGRKSAAAAQADAIYSEVGGAAQYQEVIKWAAENLNADDVAQYNKIVQSGDVKQQAFAARSLLAQYRANNSAEPARTIEGRRGASTGSMPFASRAEMVSAMQDPRYQKDPAYRAQVISRIEHTA